MGLTKFPNGVSSFGFPVMGGGGIPAMYGDVYFVDYANGSDANDGKDMDHPVKTLGRAHTLATTNNNDVIVLNSYGRATHYQEASMLTWSKNKIHVIGLGTFGAVDMQPEIQLSTAGNAADNAATIKVTGYGNTFTNLYISNAGTHANSVTALWDAGENNVYTNCQFAKHSDLNVAAVSDVEARGDTTTWRNCKFGVDWTLQTAARPTLSIKGTGGSARMKHNVFENCLFVCSSSSADKAHVLVNSTSSMAFGNVMINPVFLCAIVGSISAAALDNAIDSVTGLAEGNLLVVNPATNCTAVCATVTAGIQVVGPDTHATAGAPNTPS
jgi:hypothetical protein